MKRTILAAALFWPLGLGTAQAALDTVKVTDGVYALVGEKQQRSPENLGNNATFGVVVTGDGVVLMDPGGSWLGAAEIRDAIRAITDKKVTYVIDTGGQDHRWLGNGFWKAEGATVIASADAVEDHQTRGSMQMTVLDQLIGDKLAGTEPVDADTTFDTDYTLQTGGVTLEIHHAGAAHTPGDSFVWLADRGVVFTGDIVYVERILGVGDQSDSASWVEVFEAVAALNPAHVVPGHGGPTTLARAKAETYDYLVNLRDGVGAHIEAGGDIIGSVEVDQSAFSHLEQFENLARRNAQQVFQQMEWE